MLIVVVVYVRAQHHGLKNFLAVLEKRDELLTVISDRCHETQRATTQQTTEALRETSRVMGQVTRAIDRMNGAR